MKDRLTSLRLTHRVLLFLDGGSLFQSPNDLDGHGYGPEGRRLVETVRAAQSMSRRKDGSVVSLFGEAEVELLGEFADYLACAAADDAGSSPDALGDLNAARGLLRQIDRAKKEATS